MIKTIPVSALRVGMFVVDFKAGWLNHPFWFNRKAITSQDDIERVLRSGIANLVIDTERGLDVADAVPTAPAPEVAAAETASSPAKNTEENPLPRAALLSMTLREEAELRAYARNTSPVSLAAEYDRAGVTYRQATRVVREMLEDVRLGRQLDLNQLEPVVENITASVLRNSNALLTLRRLQQREDHTFVHSVGVSVMCVLFGKVLGLELATLHQLALGGMLHDIGKARIPSELLNKRSTLSEEEERYVRTHVVQGMEIVRDLPGMPRMALDVIEQHHERFDGSGYPQGLSGEAISQAGRMAAIVDCYEVITSQFSYHETPLSPADAVRHLYAQCGTQFDPLLVQAFVRSVGIYPVGSLVSLASGKLAVVVAQHESNLLQPLVRVIYDSKRQYYLSPVDLNLARPEAAGERIVGDESPAKWGIELNRFLGS